MESKPNLTLVVGVRGTGKSSFLVYQGHKAKFERGEYLKRRSTEKTIEINKKYGLHLTPPDKVPIYSPMRMRFLEGYYKYYEPYFINPYYIGVNDGSGKPALYVAPCSVVIIPELQRIINSRKSATFPDRLSQWFEESRHFDIEFWGDGQRGHLMDVNVRAITDKIIEMQGVENEKDGLGRVIKTTWHCREFYNVRDYDDYIKNNARCYKETAYEYNGNIFACYDSQERASDFIPPRGEDFAYMQHLTSSERQRLPAEQAAVYNIDEPEWFRGKYEKEEEKEN